MITIVSPAHDLADLGIPQQILDAYKQVPQGGIADLMVLLMDPAIQHYRKLFDDCTKHNDSYTEGYSNLSEARGKETSVLQR